MNTETATLLETHFEIAFDSPKGVQKLRELILTLAIQGKLVPQDPMDESASELLKKIEVEKQRLVVEGKIKQPKALCNIKQNEIPYDLPKGWQWVRFGEIIINRDGERIPVSKEDRQQIAGEYDYYGASGVIDKVNDFLFDKDLLLIGEDGANLVNRSTPIAFIARGKYWVNNHAHVIDATHFTLLLYLEKYINAIDLKPYVTGTAQPKMNQAKMHSIVIGLPPIAEQHRIVAKIEQLMARCDELETLRNDRNQKRTNVHTAAIDRLLTAKADGDFQTAWTFISNHFSELYSVKENVAELRKAILQLAVMGKLVPQDPTDEPASELLKAIEFEKQRLVKEGKIKKSKPLPDINPAELHYDLPEGWECVRLGKAGTFERGKSKHRPRNDQRLFSGGTYPFVQTGDVSKSKLTKNEINSCSGYYNDFGLQQSRLWSKDTLCITIAANIAETGFLGMEACIPDSIVAFSSIDRVLSKLVKVFIDVAKEDLERFAPSTAQKNINLEIINELIFPLPPLAEQHRIVAKIDRLMELCDRLDQQIEAAKTKQTELLNSLMAKV